jgi:glycerate dehydrogenase
VKSRRIVVVDGHSMNPGDLSYETLAALGELTVYPRSGASLLQHCQGAHVVLTNKERFDASLLAQLPELEFIAVTATGCNVVDLLAAKARQIPVSNVPGYSTDAVAQHVFALLLELNNRTSEHVAASRDGRWTAGGDFSLTLGPIHDLAGKTLGIVGYGAIGQRVRTIAEAFGMRVIAAARSAGRASNKVQASQAPADDVERVPLGELFETSDVISLHCPLTRETENLVNHERLKSMKPTAYLINTGRGPLVDEAALAAALADGTIAGAGLDVLCREPPSADHPLLSEKHCLVTPHLAWASVEARTRLLRVTIENVRGFLMGSPQNVVNP